MIKALAEVVEDHFKGTYCLRTKAEGLPRDGWILADYGDVVVHVFSPDQRAYYQLEDLWSEGRVLLHLQ